MVNFHLAWLAWSPKKTNKSQKSSCFIAHGLWLVSCVGFFFFSKPKRNRPPKNLFACALEPNQMKRLWTDNYHPKTSHGTVQSTTGRSCIETFPEKKESAPSLSRHPLSHCRIYGPFLAPALQSSGAASTHTKKHISLHVQPRCHVSLTNTFGPNMAKSFGHSTITHFTPTCCFHSFNKNKTANPGHACHHQAPRNIKMVLVVGIWIARVLEEPAHFNDLALEEVAQWYCRYLHARYLNTCVKHVG